MLNERIRLQFESMGLSNEAQQQANEFFEITKDGKAELVEQQVTKSQNYTQLYNSIIELLSSSPDLNNYLIY